MSESFDFRQTTHFTVGAVGQPGDRVFYLQMGDQLDMASVKMEKQQVQALAEFLSQILKDLPTPSKPSSDPSKFNTPSEPDWIVGQIAVGIDTQSDEHSLILEVKELTILNDSESDAETLIRSAIESELADGALIRAVISIDQALHFIAESKKLMRRGRSTCRLCGKLIDPTGHSCPRLN